MPLIDATSRRFRLLVGAVDFSQSVQGELLFEPQIDDYSGLVTVTGRLNLVLTVTTPESLDPWFNNRWQVGAVVIFEVANTAGELVRHPHYGWSRIATQPFYTEPIRTAPPTLALELSCELGYWLETTPTGDCSGIDPRVGLARDEVISRLLAAASGGQGLHRTGGEPTDLVFFPPPSREGLLQTAGLLALASPTGPGYLWADGFGRFRFSYEPNATTVPALTLTPADLIDTRLLNPQEYARPFETLILTGPQIEVTPTTWPQELPPVETFLATDLEGDGSTSDYLDQGEYSTETYNPTIGLLTRWTIFKSTEFRQQVEISPGGFGGAIYYTAHLVVTGVSRQDFQYYPTPAGFQSCDPDDNPKTNAGLIQNYERRLWSFTVDQILAGRPNFDIELSGPLSIQNRVAAMKPTFIETIAYEYSVEQWLALKRWAAYPNLWQLPNPDGTPNPDPNDEFRMSTTPVWAKTEAWEKTGCESWRKYTLPFGPDGEADKDYTNISAPPVRPGRMVTESEVNPEALTRAPLGFSTCEETRKSIAVLPPRGGQVTEKRRTITLPLVTSQSQLDLLALARSKLFHERIYGRSFTSVLLDELLATTYQPLFTCQYVAGVSQWLHRVEGPLLGITQDECQIQFDAPLISQTTGTTISYPYSLDPPIPVRYSCVSGTCVPDSQGVYPDLAACQAQCGDNSADCQITSGGIAVTSGGVPVGSNCSPGNAVTSGGIAVTSGGAPVNVS